VSQLDGGLISPEGLGNPRQPKMFRAVAPVTTLNIDLRSFTREPGGG
jgi:hypothetical protein